MWQSAGICRSQAGLSEALTKVNIWREALAGLESSQCLLNLQPQQTVQLESAKVQGHIRTIAETFNLLEIADLILQSAVFRTESRGGHYRSDYPQTSTSWEMHTFIQKTENANHANTRIWQSPQMGLDLEQRKIAG